MKILLTGCSGYIGSAVLQKAVARYGADSVVALTSSSINQSVKVVLHNGYDFDSNIFIAENLSDIDTIVHIGAFIPKSQNEANDMIRCNSNIFNTEKLLSALPPCLSKIIYTSTIDIYDTADVISENTNEKPESLYGWSKLYCEKIVRTFAEKNGLTCQILRIGHVYGPGEDKYKKNNSGYHFQTVEWRDCRNIRRRAGDKNFHLH